MPIAIQCFQCGQQFSAADNLMGQQVQCPRCRGVFVVGPSVPVQPAAFNALDRPPATHQPLVDGPTDAQFRMGAAVCIPLMLIGMAIAVATWKGPTMAPLVIVGLGPFVLFCSIAALIDPNIARAAGKYGTHLPARYKLIAGLVGLAALVAAAIITLPLLLR